MAVVRECETPFVPVGRWPARASTALSGFLRWSRGRRGFDRIRRVVIRAAKRLLGGRRVPVRYYEGRLWVDPASRLDLWIFVDGSTLAFCNLLAARARPSFCD